jgi:hypothetical protein
MQSNNAVPSMRNGPGKHNNIVVPYVDVRHQTYKIMFLLLLLLLLLFDF